MSSFCLKKRLNIQVKNIWLFLKNLAFSNLMYERKEIQDERVHLSIKRKIYFVQDTK